MKGKATSSSDELQLHEDIAFQGWIWRIERVAWGAIAILVTLALLGMLGGGGVLADARAGDSDSTLWVDYKRFARRGAITELRVYARPTGERWTLHIGGSLLRDAEWTSSPPPEEMELRGNLHRLMYLLTPGTESAQVTLRIEHRRAGRKSTEISSESATVVVSQFVYP